MATTTATLTLTSADLLSDSFALTSTATLWKAGSTEGLDQVRMGRNEIPTGTSFDLLDATTAAIDKSNKVYIANHSTDETFYVTVAIDGAIGRLYAGDWMFIPWGCVDQHDDIELQAYGGTNTICYAYFHEGRTLTAS